MGSELHFPWRRVQITPTSLTRTLVPLRGALSPQTTLGNLEDGNWHTSQVTWDASTQTLSYWIDGELGGTLTGDLAQQYFGGSDLVHFGFTGSTGSSANVQLVQVTGFDANLLCAECETDHSHMKPTMPTLKPWLPTKPSLAVLATTP